MEKARDRPLHRSRPAVGVPGTDRLRRAAVLRKSVGRLPERKAAVSVPSGRVRVSGSAGDAVRVLLRRSGRHDEGRLGLRRHPQLYGGGHRQHGRHREERVHRDYAAGQVEDAVACEQGPRSRPVAGAPAECAAAPAVVAGLFGQSWRGRVPDDELGRLLVWSSS